MAKTRRIKKSRVLRGGDNEYGPDTKKLMRRLADSEDTDELDISGLNITSLPQLPPTLEYLDVSETRLTSLPQLPPTLEILDVSKTQITTLPDLLPNLEMLYVSETQITSLPELPPTLTELDVSKTQITTLPDLPPTLEVLDVSETQITSLPELPDNLEELHVQGTRIPPMKPRENGKQYNIRMKARDLSAAEQTIFQPTSEEDTTALGRVRNANILVPKVTEFLTGKKDTSQGPQPSIPVMRQLKKEVTGRYGGRTKKNK